MQHRPRRLTVLNFYHPNDKVVPKLHLMGDWLRNAGFPAGSRVHVTVQDEKLIIEVVAPPDPDWRQKKLAR